MTEKLIETSTGFSADSSTLYLVMPSILLPSTIISTVSFFDMIETLRAIVIAFHLLLFLSKETTNPEEVAYLYTEGLREISAYLSKTDAVDESLETQIKSCAE